MTCTRSLNQMFARFIERSYAATLHRAAKRMQSDQAEDVVHDAVVNLLQNEEFDPARPDAVGYLRRKVAWILADRARARKQGQSLLEEYEDDALAPLEELALQERREQVRQAVEELPPALAAIVKCWLRGLSPEQTAEELDVARPVVYRRFHKAKALLRRALLAGKAL